MQKVVLSILLSDLGRDALKVATGVGLAIFIAIAFAISSLLVVFAPFFGSGPALPPSATGPDTPVSGAPNARIVELARAQLGMPYVWGGASPETSFDCSGLVQWVYSQVGVSLPRTAQQQFDATTRISDGQLRPGDLVYFQATYPSADRITHVGIYVGDGLMINAPSEGKVVSVMPVFTGFWGEHYAGAGRAGG